MFNIAGSTYAYSVWIWLATGLVLLRLDTRRLQNQNLGKEKKIARFAGWFNLAAGAVLMILNLLN